jgi:D-serine deaminase-like pyridoxal phosphate-dependent protein
MKTISKHASVKLDTPAILLDWEQVKKNVERMARICGAHGIQIMPHIKTHKSVAIARLQLEAGATGLTCAKISEGMALLPSGVRRIFLAHSISSASKIPSLIELSNHLDELIVAATSLKQIEVFAQLLEATDLHLPCLLSLDTGLGREGARSLEELRKMKDIVDRSSGLNYRGIYSHEGFTYMSTPQQIPEQAKAVAARLREAREALGGEGELWPGCSVTAQYMATEAGITGIRPGAYLNGDLYLTRLTGAMNWEDLALCVATTVVDKPEPGLALIDAGTKVFSSDKSADLPFALPLDQSDYALTRMSEEHGFVTGPDTKKLSIGDVIILVPTHICPVVNLSDHYLALKENSLEMLPIEARGCVR